MRKVHILPLLMLFVIGLSGCFGEPRHKIEGLTKEIYRECSGLWTLEKYIRNERITGPWNVSWGNNAFGNHDSLLIDLYTDSDFEIWPDMEPLVVKKVKKINATTIEMVVNRTGTYMNEEWKWVPNEDRIITMHILEEHRMWIDTTDSNGGSLIWGDGPDHIYKKVSGPDVKPMFTKASPKKDFMTPP